MTQPHGRPRNVAGFTAIEIIVVLALIAIVTSLAAPMVVEPLAQELVHLHGAVAVVDQLVAVVHDPLLVPPLRQNTGRRRGFRQAAARRGMKTYAAMRTPHAAPPSRPSGGRAPKPMMPFSLIGAVWLLFALDYNLSVAVWVGVIALAGLDEHGVPAGDERGDSRRSHADAEFLSLDLFGYADPHVPAASRRARRNSIERSIENA